MYKRKTFEDIYREIKMIQKKFPDLLRKIREEISDKETAGCGLSINFIFSSEEWKTLKELGWLKGLKRGDPGAVPTQRILCGPAAQIIQKYVTVQDDGTVIISSDQ